MCDGSYARYAHWYMCGCWPEGGWVCWGRGSWSCEDCAGLMALSRESHVDRLLLCTSVRASVRRTSNAAAFFWLNCAHDPVPTSGSGSTCWPCLSTRALYCA